MTGLSNQVIYILVFSVPKVCHAPPAPSPTPKSFPEVVTTVDERVAEAWVTANRTNKIREQLAKEIRGIVILGQRGPWVSHRDGPPPLVIYVSPSGYHSQQEIFGVIRNTSGCPE
jgi:hypothetical protein